MKELLYKVGRFNRFSSKLPGWLLETDRCRNEWRSFTVEEGEESFSSRKQNYFYMNTTVYAALD